MIHLILALVQFTSGLIGLLCWLRYRHLHRCSVCGSRPFRLYRAEFANGSADRRCAAHTPSSWLEG